MFEHAQTETTYQNSQNSHESIWQSVNLKRKKKKRKNNLPPSTRDIGKRAVDDAGNKLPAGDKEIVDSDQATAYM